MDSPFQVVWLASLASQSALDISPSLPPMRWNCRRAITLHLVFSQAEAGKFVNLKHGPHNEYIMSTVKAIW